MANRVGMDKPEAIKGLAASGQYERQIARTLGVSRKAVRRHLGREGSKETTAPPGKTPTGSNSATERTDLRSRSLCAWYWARIITQLEQGLTAQRIHQDLMEECGLSGQRRLLRRYVHQLSLRPEAPFRRMETAPGCELQVDDDCGAPRRGHAMGMETLSRVADRGNPRLGTKPIH